MRAYRDFAKLPVVSLAQPARAGETQKPLPRPALAGSTGFDAFFNTLLRKLIRKVFRRSAQAACYNHRNPFGKVNGCGELPLFDCLHPPGIRKPDMFLFRRKLKPDPSAVRLEIILYHFVSDQRDEFTLSGHNVATAEFRRQLEYLAARYRIIRLRDVLQPQESGDPARPLAAVCFDDGYRCILKEAYPILRDMRIPATMFVNPQVLGNRDLLWRDKIRFLLQKGLEHELTTFLRLQHGAYRFGQLEKLGFYKWSKHPKALRNMQIQKDVDAFFAQKGFNPATIAAEHDLFMGEADITVREYLDFGNHTWSHPILTLLSDAAQKDEIVRCHEFLTGRGIPPAGLALPFSPYNRDTLAICRTLGYPFILTVFEESNYLALGKQERPVVLHRWMAPKNADGLAAIV
jgi:peptidoglycan/xylan/chitin deacetylase (PgdA/CDA1 family)